MVKIFKTNVIDPIVAKQIRELLTSEDPMLRINFDLEDVDRILRVEGKLVEAQTVINCISKFGHSCVYLPLDFND